MWFAPLQSLICSDLSLWWISFRGNDKNPCFYMGKKSVTSQNPLFVRNSLHRAIRVTVICCSGE